MNLCYIDESGTPDIPGNTSHFVLTGVSIPIQSWKSCDQEIETIKSKYGLADQELHFAWMLRAYPEQNQIPDFATLDHRQRASQVAALRNSELLRLQRSKNPKLYKQTRKNYKQTESYIHLSYNDRRALVKEVAQKISSWSFVRLFAECIDKIHFDPLRTNKTVDEQAFEQIVSRFEQYLQGNKGNNPSNNYGMLIHDNNETVAKKHTLMMKKFHQAGTLWTNINQIIETPLFVDSKLTSMIQIADLCGYALRRYLENNEEELFDLVFKRADRRGNTVVGVRHFTKPNCICKICATHKKTG